MHGSPLHDRKSAVAANIGVPTIGFAVHTHAPQDARTARHISKGVKLVARSDVW